MKKALMGSVSLAEAVSHLNDPSYRGVFIWPEKVLEEIELPSSVEQVLVQQQAEVVCQRVNDILQDLHREMHSDPDLMSFSQRLYVEAFVSDPNSLKSHVLNKLSSEQSIAVEVAAGRKDTAMDIDFITSGFRDEMRSRLEERCEEIAAVLLERCIDDVTKDTMELYES